MFIFTCQNIKLPATNGTWPWAFHYDYILSLSIQLYMKRRTRCPALQLLDLLEIHAVYFNRLLYKESLFSHLQQNQKEQRCSK